jgi:hypothetical protein
LNTHLQSHLQYPILIQRVQNGNKRIPKSNLDLLSLLIFPYLQKQTTKVKEKGFVLMLKYCHHQGCGLFNVLELNLRTLETCSNIRMRLEGIVYLRQQMGLRDQFGSLGNHQQVGNKGYQATKSDPFE